LLDQQSPKACPSARSPWSEFEIDAGAYDAFVEAHSGANANKVARNGETTRLSYSTIRPIAVTIAKATIDARIETGPIVDRRWQRSWKTWHWKIGCD
jgi:hypothetical protein